MNSSIELRSWRRIIVCQKRYFSERFQTLCENLDEACEAPEAIILKQGKSSTVVKSKMEEGWVVVKRSNDRNIFHACRRLLRPSRARINWVFAQAMKLADVATIEPMAMVENRWGPFRRKSYLLYSFLEGMDLFQAFADGQLPHSQWKAVIRGVNDMIEKLADKGLCHRDLNLSNIILIDHQPFLIDLDSMRYFGKNAFIKWFLKKKMWSRLIQNIEEVVGNQTAIISAFRGGMHVDRT